MIQDKKQLLMEPVLRMIQQEIEGLLRIPMLDCSTISYLEQKKELVRKSTTCLTQFDYSQIKHSKESALILLGGRLPMAYESLIYQFIEYRLTIQKRLLDGDDRHYSLEISQQQLGEIECIIDFLLVEAEKNLEKKTFSSF